MHVLLYYTLPLRQLGISCDFQNPAGMRALCIDNAFVSIDWDQTPIAPFELMWTSPILGRRESHLAKVQLRGLNYTRAWLLWTIIFDIGMGLVTPVHGKYMYVLFVLWKYYCRYTLTTWFICTHLWHPTYRHLRFVTKIYNVYLLIT